MRFKQHMMAIVCIFVALGSQDIQLIAQDLMPLGKKAFADLENVQHEIGNGKPILLVFINADCPIANSFQPSLQKLKSDFSNRDIDFAMIYGDPSISKETAKKHRQDFSITWPLVIDPENTVARYVSAKITPEAFLIDGKGNILYRGRIDDRYPEYGKRRAAPTREDLRIALDEFLAGTKITMPTSKAIGCVIRLKDFDTKN